MVERRSAAAAEERTGAEGGCLNCGTALAGDFCHACGQKAHVHRSIAAFAHDIAHAVLHADGKLWRTLPLLAWRPGELTRRYVAGERARFVSPLGLFLLTVFLMFALFSAFGGISVNLSGIQSGLDKEIGAVEARIADTEQARTESPAGRGAAADAALEEQRAELEALRRVRDRTADSAVRVSDQAPRWLQHVAAKASDNPQLLLYKLQANGYKFSWVLIPLSLPFVWMLFLHRQRYRRYGAYDHVVFVTYSIAFMSLLLIGYALLAGIGLGGAALFQALLLIGAVHLYRQLKDAYELPWWSALWRTAALAIAALVVLALFLSALLTAGALG